MHKKGQFICLEEDRFPLPEAHQEPPLLHETCAMPSPFTVHALSQALMHKNACSSFPLIKAADCYWLPGHTSTGRKHSLCVCDRARKTCPPQALANASELMSSNTDVALICVACSSQIAEWREEGGGYTAPIRCFHELQVSTFTCNGGFL